MFLSILAEGAPLLYPCVALGAMVLAIAEQSDLSVKTILTL